MFFENILLRITDIENLIHNDWYKFRSLIQSA